LYIAAIQICLCLSFVSIFASFVEKYWGEEITVRAQKTNLTHIDYLYFSIEALGTVGYGDAAANNSRVGSLSLIITSIVPILFRPVSEFIIYEFFCYLYLLSNNRLRDFSVVVQGEDDADDA
jgi:hypothetical protein